MPPNISYSAATETDVSANAATINPIVVQPEEVAVDDAVTDAVPVHVIKPENTPGIDSSHASTSLASDVTIDSGPVCDNDDANSGGSTPVQDENE